MLYQKMLIATCALLSVVTCLEVNMIRSEQIHIVHIDEKEYYNFQHGEYTTTIYVGSPPQAVKNIVLDTGSFMPWVKVNGWCTLSSCPGIPPTYNPKLSSTYSQSSGNFLSNAYGSGDVGGWNSFDKFCFNTQDSGTCFSNYYFKFVGANETSP